ncbi:3-keto-5-aminohexanoate cleavage protein [Cesiribacter sp. SM1]|uniref:3-keto-5-aminohexanoate cleavage protein n=1 Tax=Cesiribacter sp. SM1 TaxID=2861196 RepID=UPI001CD6C87D|nr:3-keto-5-aminohexanoate cleavage protein [Cesiribacter sp. SM1]
MIQAALNGNRSEAWVPKSTVAIVQAAVSSVLEGAGSIHFHVRDEYGAETLAAKWVDEQLAALKSQLPHIPLGISTGAWIEPDLEKRLAQLQSWTQLPHFVSVNFDEPGCHELARLVSAKGIRIEAGLSNKEAALNFLNTGLQANCIRILLEPGEQTLGAAISTVESMEALLRQSGNSLPMLLHGFDSTCWPLLALAFERGYETRIGFEDTLVLPDGTKANTNADLLKAAKAVEGGHLKAGHHK